VKTIIKPVYYCDFCKKKYIHRGFAVKHEKACTNNPDRKCKICELIGNAQTDLKMLIEGYKEKYPTMKKELEKEFLNDLYEKTDGCPNCMLAIIKLLHYKIEIKEPDYNGTAITLYIFDWDYKKEYTEFWIEYNSEKNETYY
jgi:hypothetical protein